MAHELGASIVISPTQQLQGLMDAASVINSTFTFDEALQVITDQARLVIGTHQSVTNVLIGNWERGNWEHVINGLSLSDKYADYRSYDKPPDGTGIYDMVARMKRTFRMTQEELASHPKWRAFGDEKGRHPPMRGWLATPMLNRDGTCIGLIMLSDKYDDADFNKEDEDILIRFAGIAAAAIEIRRSRDEMEARVLERTTELRESNIELQSRSEELERLNRLFVGREGTMIDLKRQINEMACAAGKPEPYELSFTDVDEQPDGVAP